MRAGVDDIAMQTETRGLRCRQLRGPDSDGIHRVWDTVRRAGLQAGGVGLRMYCTAPKSITCMVCRPEASLHLAAFDSCWGPAIRVDPRISWFPGYVLPGG